MKTDMKDKKPSSREIDRCIYRIAEGDETALEQLYDLTNSAIFAYALSLTRNRFDAEDVMHDCFVKVYESAAQYKSHGKPMAWMLTIAKNMCYQRLNQSKRFADVKDEDIERMFGDNTSVNADDRMTLKACLSQLTAVERQIIVMHAVGGMKHREIADMLGIPLSTTLSKYNRALDKLKNMIGAN